VKIFVSCCFITFYSHIFLKAIPVHGRFVSVLPMLQSFLRMPANEIALQKRIFAYVRFIKLTFVQLFPSKGKSLFPNLIAVDPNFHLEKCKVEEPTTYF